MCLIDMRQLKGISFVLMLLIAVSCVDNQDNLVKRQVAVDIYESTIPTEGTINQDIQIQLKAQAITSTVTIRCLEIKPPHRFNK
jgi:hypothetical protein